MMSLMVSALAFVWALLARFRTPSYLVTTTVPLQILLLFKTTFQLSFDSSDTLARSILNDLSNLLDPFSAHHLVSSQG